MLVFTSIQTMVTHTWHMMVCHVWVSEGGSSLCSMKCPTLTKVFITQSSHGLRLVDEFLTVTMKLWVTLYSVVVQGRWGMETYQWGTSWGDTEDQRTQLPGTGSLFSVGTQSRSRSCLRLAGTVCGVWPETHWREIINNLPGETQNATCLLKPIAPAFKTALLKQFHRWIDTKWHKQSHNTKIYLPLMLLGFQQYEPQGDDQVTGPTEPLVGPVESILNKMRLLLCHSVMYYSSLICCSATAWCSTQADVLLKLDLMRWGQSAAVCWKCIWTNEVRANLTTSFAKGTTNGSKDFICHTSLAGDDCHGSWMGW